MNNSGTGWGDDAACNLAVSIHEEFGRVKHTKAITRKPQVAQLSNFQAFKQFLVNLTDQAVEFVFQKTD